MEPLLPFQSIKSREFREIYKPGWRALELEDIWAGRQHVRNEWSQALMIQSRKKHYKRGVKDLKILFRQPVEIIYEVFGHLHPIDLYHIFLSTDTLEDMLFPPKVSWLWQLVFKRHPEVPDKPMGIEYPSWADLLFGPFHCDDCPARCIPPNWFSRRRLCRQCAKRKDLKVMDYDEDELRDVYWQYEIDEKTFCLDFLQSRLDLDIEGASTYVTFPLDFSPEEWTQGLVWYRPLRRHIARDPQDFADHLVAFLRFDYDEGLDKMKEHPSIKWVVNYFVENYTTCLIWTNSMASLVAQQAKDEKARIARWGKRKTGFTYHHDTWAYLLASMDRFRDLLNVDDRHLFRDLRRQWKKYKPIITSHLDEYTFNRNGGREQDRLETRKLEITETHNELRENTIADYAKHPQAELPVPDSIFPSAAELLLYEPFNTILRAHEPDFEDPDMDTVDDYVTKFQALLKKWRPKTMTALAELCPMLTLPKCMERYPKMKPNSAAAIFYCVGCHHGLHSIPGVLVPTPSWSRKVLVGWENVIKHLDDGCPFLKLPHPFQVHEQASQASMFAIQIYEENPAKLDEEDMMWTQAEEDFRLTCLNCPDIVRSGLAMMWEDCIAHTILFQGDPGHKTPKWRKVRESNVKKKDIIGVFL